MKWMAVLFVAAALARISHSEVVEDGLYWISSEQSGKAVPKPDGRTVRVAGKCGFKIIEASISSQNNANDQFYLSVTIPVEPKLQEMRTVLVCGGLAYTQTSAGTNANESSSIGMPIPGQDKAESVAKFFGVTAKLRKHPGYCLLVSFTPDKTEYKPGEDVTVKLRIENVGEKPFSFQKGGANRAARDTQYRFSAELNGKPIIDTGSNMNFGGLSFIKTVKPKEVFEDSIVLNKWFSFKEPGMYVILGSYGLTFHDPEDNKSYFALWQDYATAEFVVNVKDEDAK